MIGDSDDAADPREYGSFFGGGCNLNTGTLPDTHVASVEADLKKHMAAQALGTPLEPNRTVRSVMQEMGMVSVLLRLASFLSVNSINN